jgi:hypothetical protein
MKKITREFLRTHPNFIFVYGDNYLRIGLGGGASLREEPNTYGFITKKKPSNEDNAFFKPDEYSAIYRYEISKLRHYIKSHPQNLFLISKLGSGLANKYRIFEYIIEPHIKKDLLDLENVHFLW